MSHNHGGRDQGDASITRQGMPKIVSKLPEVIGEIHERDSPSRTSKETSSAHIISIISDSVYGSSGKQIQYGNTMQFHSYMLDKKLILDSKFIFK